MSDRNIRIDTLRAVACIFLVAYHVVGGGPDFGLKISNGWLREANDNLGYFRMPLFTFLSGIVYTYRPLERGFLKEYIYGKVRRLLIPLLAVGTSFALFRSAISGTNGPPIDWTTSLHILPIDHFWFIESLFIIFMLLILLELTQSMSTLPRALTVLFISILVYLNIMGTRYFSISGAIYLLPYFLMGLIVQRFNFLVILKPATGLVILLTVLALLLTIPNSFQKRSFYTLMIGGMGCVGLLALNMKSVFLAGVGIFSYTIYLFHVFFTAASRIVLSAAGFDNVYFLLTVGIISGIVGPILLDIIASKYSLGRLLLLGKSTSRSDLIQRSNRSQDS